MNAQNYRETRTKAELDELLRYDFVIPISRGLIAKYVSENYPGWTWNQLIGILNASGVRIAKPGRPSACHDDVIQLHFDSEQSWRVEWADGTTTEGPAPAGTTRPAGSSGIAAGVHDLATGRMVELPEAAEDDIADADREVREASGWPADDHPIFIDAGFGRVQSTIPLADGLGEPRRLTAGASVRADAAPHEFAKEWAALLAETPTGSDRWEYSVEEPQREEAPTVTGPLPVDVALERVRVIPGARLRRRAVSGWHIMETPFPSLAKDGWAYLEPQKNEWHAALDEFPPSYRGSISRMGGMDAAPQKWIEFARRAAAVGFTPFGYRMLGTAHLAWTAREAESRGHRTRELPDLTAIEGWALFPGLIAEQVSPLGAIERILRKL